LWIELMCIACELGYWSMIDALEAERAVSGKKAARADDAGFACEASAEQPKRKRRRGRVQQSTDEPAP
jgi:hypothetical protein